MKRSKISSLDAAIMARSHALVFLALIVSAQAGVLQVSNGRLSINGQRVFLSGPNIAWYSYGYDFGNNQYDNLSGSTLESWLQSIANAGGNSVRIWLHVEGYNTPTFDGNGFVTGLDNTGSMISDMRRYLDAAQAQNIVVIFVLWNGAVMSNPNVNNLVWDNAKLTSYIDNALKPMVAALAGHRALGAWEIMNEPEGSVSIASNANPCSDTTALGGTGAGWSGANIPMERFQVFINWQADAIRSTDPNTLITLGSWSEQPQSSTLGKYNYYTDACLTGVGGKPGGYIDFYQIHTYSWQGVYSSSAPFKHSASEYGLDKPLLIGEFSAACSENNPSSWQFDYLYYHGYDGGMSWHYAATGDCTDSQQVQNDGFSYIRNYNDPNNGGLVDFTV